MRTIASVAVALLFAADAAAQIRVNPTGVNVQGHGATTAFLTFGRLNGYVPAEGMWCGELTAAAPDLGLKCDPNTMFGMLPARFDWSRRSGRDGFTDIMSVPPSVTRRAYDAAVSGRGAAFFYVRRFVRTASPDEYVPVTCRLTGGGARVPLSLVDVHVRFHIETPVLQIATGSEAPPLFAQIQYTGSGRLVGRWEIVLPGQEPPGERDLLTEATLPLEERTLQRRYSTIDRFNVFLPPTGRFTLPGPDPARLPTAVDGQYLVLLRVEASDEKEADSDLALVDAGPGVVHSGGVAGFPMPVLRYIVGAGGSEHSSVAALGAPTDGIGTQRTTVLADGSLEVRWPPVPRARYYRVEVEVGGHLIHQAFVAHGASGYIFPPFVKDKTAEGFRWRIVAIDTAGRTVLKSDWRDSR